MKHRENRGNAIPMFTVDQLIKMAMKYYDRGAYSECLDLLRKIPSQERPRDTEKEALYRAGKIHVAKGEYGKAKELFAEALIGKSPPVFLSLLQERNQLLNQILNGNQQSAPALESEYRQARVGTPKRLSEAGLRPFIWYAGCPASYRSGYDMERNDPLSRLIRMMKKGVEESTIEHLGRFLAAFVYEKSPVLPKADIIIPVPSDPGRTTERGYSIPRILGEQLSKHCVVPLHEEMVAVSGQAPELRYIPRWMRAEAIEGAFTLERKAHWLKGLSVLVVDDVITSGSTVLEVAKVLKCHGAVEVAAVALAHTERSYKF